MTSSLSQGDWQNFIYLALLLTLFLGSLLTRREMPLGKILKYFGIWSGLALAIIILYSYRYEFSDVKTRVIGELNPSAAQVKDSGQLVIKLSEDGHFYMNVKINRIPVRFMIDTGASDIVLNADEAKRIGIDLRKLVFNKTYQTANGKSRGASVNLKEVIVGNVKFQNIPASVNEADMGISLLGMSFLRQFSKYEFYREELVLTM